MHATFRIITPPAISPVDTDLALRHARIDSDGEVDLFEIYLSAATSEIEKYLGRALITQTLNWTISQSHSNTAWPYAIAPISMAAPAYDWMMRQLSANIIEVPYAPIQSIVSVTTGEWGSSDTTLVAGDDYTTDLTMDPARLRLNSAYSWGTYNHLSITYLAGYGSTPADIPKPIINAIMMRATSLYENRGDDEKGHMSRAVRSLLEPYRIYTHGR